MRKCFVFFLFSFVALQLAAQTSSKVPSFSLQLKKILTATQNNFKDYIGEKVKVDGEDIVYNSTTTLVGTTDNQVMDFASGKSYMAKLGDGLTEKEAKALIENLKKKVTAAGTSDFEIMRDDLQNSEYKRIAYLFMGDSSSISIHAMKYTDDTHYSAYLLVMKL